jgi:serine/threonine-protein kinase
VTEAPRLPVEPGEVLAGKYRVDRVLGAGAMGIVVSAHHVQLDDEVAIKFLLPGALPNAQAVERFSREARAAVKIKSEHVVRVLDVGTLDSGSPYMVMEYLNGKDLAAWLSERNVVPPIEQAVDFLLQASEAIAEAHTLGIVHRDLKPANLFVVQRPDGGYTIKVLDFGISKLLGKTTGSDMTQTSVVMGSPFYMSPEQLRSTRDVDHRSDIWALGVILYELVAGGPPFEGDTMPELVHRTVSEPPAPLRDVRPDAPPGIEDVILKCLEKDPANRYQSVAAMAAALVRFGPERSKLDVQRISGISQLAAATMPSSPAFSTAPAPSQSHSAKAESAPSWSLTQAGSKGRTALGVATGAVALLLAGWLLWPGSSTPGTTPTAEPPTSPKESAKTETAAKTATPTPPEVPNIATAAAPPSAVPILPSANPEEPRDAPSSKHAKRPPVPVVAAPAKSAAPAPSVTPAASVSPPGPPSAVPSAPKKPSIDSLIDDRK